MSKIEITIDLDGSVTVDAVGFKGKSCQEATAFLDSLGKVASDVKKPEFYRADDVAVKITKGG